MVLRRDKERGGEEVRDRSDDRGRGFHGKQEMLLDDKRCIGVSIEDHKPRINPALAKSFVTTCSLMPRGFPRHY